VQFLISQVPLHCVLMQKQPRTPLRVHGPSRGLGLEMERHHHLKTLNPAQWSTTLSSNVNLSHTDDLCGSSLTTHPADFMKNKPFALHRMEELEFRKI